MPTLFNSIPDAATTPALSIVRTPTLKAIVAVVTTPDMLGTYTHWWKGRTIPCERPQCEACDAGTPRRWHSWLGAITVSTSEPFLFELTAGAAPPLTQYKEAYGTLRGCLFQASRASARPNARVVIRTKPADLSKIKLPDPPDLVKCLAILWNLPAQDILQEGALHGLARIHADSIRAAHDWNQQDPIEVLAQPNRSKQNGSQTKDLNLPVPT